MSQNTSTPNRVDALFEKLVQAIRDTKDRRIKELIRALGEEGYDAILNVNVATSTDAAEPFTITEQDLAMLTEIGTSFLQ